MGKLKVRVATAAGGQMGTAAHLENFYWSSLLDHAARFFCPVAPVSFYRPCDGVAPDDLFNYESSVCGDGPWLSLVYSSISQMGSRWHGFLSSSFKPIHDWKCHLNTHVNGFAVYRSSVRIMRGYRHLYKHRSTNAVRGEIQSFSAKSRARLKFVAANSQPELVSSFCLTYHQHSPTDGVEVKKHINAFLTNLRKHYPSVKYLWILEFQSRGCPHFHLFLSCPPSREMGQWMAVAWNKITGETAEHLRWHAHESNFFTWDMGSGSYVTKYVDKEAQKFVPPEYVSVGRFWGCSRGLVPLPQVIDETCLDRLDLKQFDPVTGEEKIVSSKKYISRALGKWHEKILSQFGKKSRARRGPTNFLLAGSSALLWQLYQHLYQMQALQDMFWPQIPF